MVRFPTFGMAGIGIAAAVGFVLILSSISSNIPASRVNVDLPFGPEGTASFISSSSQELRKFSSVQELITYLASIEAGRSALIAAGGGPALPGFQLQRTTDSMQQMLDSDTSFREGLPTAEVVTDHSTTNVQVEGVDEPDFVKNDAKYVYILSGDRLTIIEAYPPESAAVVARVVIDVPDQYMQNMFLNQDTLVLFYQDFVEDTIIPQYEIMPQPVYNPKTYIMILDITDRSDPRAVKNYAVSGVYNNARMIGDYVYLVTTSDLYDYRQPLLPKVTSADRTLIMPDIYYFDNPEPYYNFNTVTSVNIKSTDDAINSQTFMMNPASTLYISEKNIYISYHKYQPYHHTASRERFFEAIVPLLPQNVQQQIRSIDSDTSQSEAQRWGRISAVLQDMFNRMGDEQKSTLLERIRQSLAEYDAKTQKESQRTVIHKIAIGTNGEISYVARGEVSGRLLNQFSMDEQDDRLRVATTVEFYSRNSFGMYNNVYVLDKDMHLVGKLEQIASDESIYAARFIGDRLYLVTFQQIDPFFVIDLSADPPRILGELKLPGFSSYLHPYDKDHIIGIGKETKENQFGGVETVGVKLALFDVSDVSNPRLVDDYVIGNARTDSEVLWNHKAFLFDRARDVLSIPISLYEDVVSDGGRTIAPKAWRGFYVFGVNPESGFTLRGTIDHSVSTSDYYYGIHGSRSFYIGDALYTLSLGNKLKINDIQTLTAINEINIGSTGGIIHPIPLPEPLPR